MRSTIKTSCFSESAIGLSAGVRLSPGSRATRATAEYFQAAIQDINRSILVPVHCQPTPRAPMDADCKGLLYSLTALAAILASSAWVDFNERHSGAFSLVAKLCEELSPRGIANTLREPRALKITNVQLLNSDHVIGINETLAQVVGEVIPSIGNFQVNPLQMDDCLSTVITALAFATGGTARPDQSTFQASEVFGGGRRYAIGGIDETPQPHVQADDRFDWSQGGGGHAIIYQQLSKPSTRATKDSNHLLLACRISKISATHWPNLRNEDAISGHVVHRPEAFKRMPVVSPLESRMPLLRSPLFASPIEVAEGDIKPLNRLSAYMEWHVSYRSVVASPLCQHGGLLVVFNRLLSPIPCLDALFQVVIVNAPAYVEVFDEPRLLRFSWIKPDGHYSEHESDYTKERSNP